MTLHVPIAKAKGRLGAITQIAFFVALALLAARCTILEAVREPFQVSPGVAPYPRGPGASTSLALDLLSCVPAMLVILRAAIDRGYAIRHSASIFLAVILTAWLIFSIKWANDKFAAMISAADFAAAIVLLWTAMQLVRSWLRVRVVAAIVFGLLIVLLVHGIYYKFVELPDLIQNFEQSKAQILRDRGFAPGSFAARQLENKITAGELIGFNASANTFAAMIVLTTMIGIGAIIQRRADRDTPGWIAALLVPLPVAAWLLVCTESKAGAATAILGLIMFWAIRRWRGVLATRPAKSFHVALAIVILAMLAVIAHGLFHGGLPTASLNFRWRYWTASWRMFLRHPIRGIGWANFGPHYLRDRLPAASEEIRDPHDFMVRFFVELGAVGGVLLVVWMIRLWREMTVPITPAPPTQRAVPSQSRAAIGILFATAVLSMAIATCASLDFTQDLSFIVIEIMKRCLYLCALAIGSMLVALRSLQDPRLDDRPAPWILYGILVALGLFLIHNLIEFSLFEQGATCLFGFLCGTALGARQPDVAARRSRSGSAVALALITATLFAAAVFVWIPVTQAEDLAQSGDDALRAAHFDEAAADYQQAFARWKWNADYAFRAGRALQIELDSLLAAGKESQVPAALRVQIRSFYTAAISHDPSNISAYLQRAALSLQVLDADQVVSDFNRVVYLDPNDVDIRLQYAAALEKLRLPKQAAEQFQLALFYNSQLDRAEPKRLPEDEVSRINMELDALSGS